jgi:hypothetical protein
MKRSEVYSWRVAADVKAALESEARREGRSIGGVLEQIAREWLATRREGRNGEEEQARLHRAAARTFGAISSGRRDGSVTVRAAVRRRLAGRRGR